MAGTAKVIECPCGVLIEGETTEDAVAKAQTHAMETHDMELTTEQAMSMTRPA